MVIAQRELARRFARGYDPEDIPAVSNVEVVEANGGRDDAEAWIVGYGWAIYAVRYDDGTVALCNGWRGYSMSTSCQLTELRQGFSAALGTSVDDHAKGKVVEEGRPSTRSPPSSTDLVGTTPAR